MLNPYVLLALLIAFVVDGTGMFFYGQKVAHNADLARQTTTVVQEIKKSNADTVANFDGEVIQQYAAAKQEASHVTHTKKLTAALAVDHAASACGLDPASYRVYLDSINAANATTEATAPSSGDATVPASTSAAGRIIDFSYGRGSGHSVGTLHMPP